LAKLGVDQSIDGLEPFAAIVDPKAHQLDFAAPKRIDEELIALSSVSCK
jgi:hypothetical protein